MTGCDTGMGGWPNDSRQPCQMAWPSGFGYLPIATAVGNGQLLSTWSSLVLSSQPISTVRYATF
jgi:hypothetical protein